MCCRTNSTDTCNSDGLCQSDWDGNLWRDFCTDPTWQAPGCTKLCLGSLGTDGDGNTGGSVRVTQCSNGSYCCGVGSNANECCSTGGGVWIAKNGHTTSVNPSATTGAAASSSSTTTTSSSTKATSSTQTTPTAQGPTAAASTSKPTSSSKSSSNTGVIAGGVVGGVVAIAIIAVAVLLVLRKRKNKRLMNEKNNHDAYTNGMHKQPQMYGEMDAQNARLEMLGSRTQHEMSAEGYYNPKATQPVHELQ
ncbi:MAG: hypothetical protein Q9218_005300 [Villophora microphyllina]